MSGVADGDIRASDAERQVVIDRLSRAVGDGLITLDEFADSAGEAYAAVTRAQLDDVTRELRLPVTVPLPSAPVVTPTPAVAAATAGEVATKVKRRWYVGIMSGDEQKGKWRIGRRTGAFAFWGSVDLDLRDAVLDGDEIEITAWAIMGGVTVIVPEGIPVESTGFMLMGGRSNRIKDVPALPGAPVIRVKGFGMWAGIDVRSKPSGKQGELGESGRPSRHGSRHDHGSGLHVQAQGALGALAAGGFPVPVPPLLPHLPAPPDPLPGMLRPRPAEPVTAPPPAAAMPLSGLVTIVCTDIVGSTRYADTLGDQRWRAVLGTHNALVRDALARHGGTEVKHSGDGFLLTFTSTRAAVQFGVDVQAALVDYRLAHPDTPLEVRIGVHAGEVERDGADVVGRNVSLACRLCDVAAPGEVLVSSIVADLADSASDLTFGDGRVHRLAGIERDVTARPAARR
jgi:class 3 adenylate cyclase